MSENRLDLTFFSAKIAELKKQIASVLVGQEQIVDLVLTAICSSQNAGCFIRGNGRTAGQY